MSSISTTTAITISLASIVVVLWIDAFTPGTTGADFETPTQTSITSAPVRRDSGDQPKQLETIVHAEDEAQRQVVEWALGRFDEAGLELPILTIYSHSDRAECDGKNGFFSSTDAGDYEVHTCGVGFTLLHELGHAWAHYGLDEQTRSEFLEIAHADSWRSDDWHLSGSEHSANVIAWGLMDTRINQTRTRPYDHSSMMRAFSTLTDGGEPLWLDG